MTDRVAAPVGAQRFYQHGWHSWSVTGWRPLQVPVRMPVVPEHRRQATDPARLDDLRPGGSGLGAVETADGVELLGSLGVDGWVAFDGDGLVGEGAGPWFGASGPESEVFGDYAAALGDVLGRRTGDPGPVWCSWYGFGREVDEALMTRAIEGLDDLPFRVVQVDDGWQRANGDWEADPGFPLGMEAMADRIAATGRVPGLWLAPLLADSWSDLARKRPEMLLRDSDGSPVVAAANWGDATFALDVTRADVHEWLTELVIEVVGWGYRYLKLDFLYAGALPGTRAEPVGREAGYRAAMETIRRAVGEDVYLLACGAPVIASIGVFDGIRVGPDTAPYWDDVNRTHHLIDRAGPGAADAIATTLSRLWLRPLIDIDPDAVYFRSRRNLLDPDQQAMLRDLARVCGFRCTSDPPWWLDAEERAELERFLTDRPVVEQLGRYRFAIDGREVDFAAVVEARPW